MYPFHSKVFGALLALLTQVHADVKIATGTGYELDGYLGQCGSGSPFIVEGDANYTPTCQGCAPSTCFDTSVGEAVKGGCVFELYTDTNCTGSDFSDATSAGAGQQLSFTASATINSVKIACEVNPTK